MQKKNIVKLTVFILWLISSLANAQNIKFEQELKIAEDLTQQHPDTARLVLNNLLGEVSLLNNKLYISKTLNDLGVLEYYLGHYEKALDFYLQAKVQLLNHKQSPLMATVKSNIGALYKSIGFYDKALSLYVEALAIDSLEEDSTKISIRLNNIAGIYAVWAKYDLAINYYQKALHIDRNLGNREYEAIRYGNIGVIYFRLKKNDLSVEYLKKALIIDKELHNDFNTAIRLNNLGRTYVQMNRFDIAIKYYLEAININIKQQNLADLSVSYNNLGKVFLKKNNNDTSKYYLTKALRIAQKIGSYAQQQIILSNLGKYYYQLGNVDQALIFYNKSLLLSENLKIIKEQASALKSLSKLYHEKENFKKESECLNLYLVLQDSIYNMNSQEKIAKYQIQFSIDKKENEIELLLKGKAIQEAKISQQRWFIIIILIIVLLIVVLIYIINRNNNLRNKEERLELEARLNKYMQKAYRQQMNPHFVFNTLNSIQSFILINDKESSSTYLSKFAMLMRMVLQNSEKELITIASEIEAIRLYLELEKLRVDKIIELKVDIDDTLLEYKLPPLIFQPFIENSIWHGFMNKEGDGCIQIKISENENNTIVCQIIDNGIGRKASEKFKKKEHKSFGMSITQKRLELIHAKDKIEHCIIIDDLTEKNGVVIGTKVTITLPLIDL